MTLAMSRAVYGVCSILLMGDFSLSDARLIASIVCRQVESSIPCHLFCQSLVTNVINIMKRNPEATVTETPSWARRDFTEFPRSPYRANGTLKQALNVKVRWLLMWVKFTFDSSKSDEMDSVGNARTNWLVSFHAGLRRKLSETWSFFQVSIDRTTSSCRVLKILMPENIKQSCSQMASNSSCSSCFIGSVGQCLSA